MKNFIFDLQRFSTKKGTSGNNNLVVKKAGTVVYGYAGNDTITNVYDKVTIFGGTGNDYVWNRGSNVQISGEAGKDFILSSGDSVKAAGGADNDSIFSYGRFATVTGDAGNDYIESQGDYANVEGGAGKDTIITSGYDVTVSGGKGNDFVSFDKYRYNHNDFHYASGDGNDTVYGFDSDDLFHITKGSYSTVKSGKNLILKIGNGSVTFLDAIDTPIQVRLPNGTYETIGGGSEDISSRGQYISNYDDDTLVSGTSKGDTIYNSGNYVTLSGGAGSDTIHTGSSEDTDVYVSGGKGNDTISGYANYATINGGAGSDIVSLNSYGVSKNNLIQYASGDGNDTIFGFDSNDTLHITKGTYSTTKSGNDFIVTVGKQKITLEDAVNDDYDKVIIKDSAGKISTYNDWTVGAVATGNSANNVKITMSSDSYGRTLNYTGDNVTLQGSAGNDSLGNICGTAVTLTGGAGNDTIKLYDDSGSNVVTYASGDGNDLVYGFRAGDSLKITKGTYKTKTSGTDLIVTVGKGKITLRGAASKPVTIVDAKGKTSTKVYGKAASSKKSSTISNLWFAEENNFVSSDNLSSIVKNNLSSADYKLETNNFKNLTNENNLLTYSAK